MILILRTLLKSCSAKNKSHFFVSLNTKRWLLYNHATGEVRVPGCAKKRICFLFFRWCTRTEVSERKASGGRFSERSRRRQEAKRAECIEAKVGDHVLRDTRTSRKAARFESRVHKKSESIDSLFIGAPSGTRTLDPLIKSQLLYQLS